MRCIPAVTISVIDSYCIECVAKNLKHSADAKEQKEDAAKSDSGQIDQSDRAGVREKLAAIAEKMGKESAFRLLSAYEHDMNGIEGKIEESIAQQDFESLQATCHFLVGCTKTLGANNAARLCSQIEVLSANGKHQEIVEKSAPMLAALHAVLETLREYATQENDGEGIN